MALTTAQRTTALAHLLYAMSMDPAAVQQLQALPGINSASFSSLLPNTTPAQVINAIIGAIGTQFDTQLNVVVTNMIAQANANATSFTSQATAMTNLAGSL